MRRLSRKLNQWAANMLDLPKDVVHDVPRITMIGNMQMYIENHRGVLHFSSDRLELKLSQGRLDIHGKGLVIRAIWTEEVFIEGTIDDIHYKK